MAAQRLRGLGEVEREGLADAEEAVEEARGSAHVVVDHQRPVGLPGRPAASSAVEVLELAALEAVATVTSASAAIRLVRRRAEREVTRWRERSAGARPAISEPGR